METRMRVGYMSQAFRSMRNSASGRT
jgi:hypothetical protein